MKNNDSFNDYWWEHRELTEAEAYKSYLLELKSVLDKAEAEQVVKPVRNK